jgi:K+-transporting ATPase ATPase B chain
MIAMVEGAKRKKTPNEIALDILLAALTIVFLLATVTLLPFSSTRSRPTARGRRSSDRARRAARLPHPHDHRRAPLGHRHRRHGPDDPGERHRDVGARGRGRGRRRRAPARQDRHHHARQPAGDAFMPAPASPSEQLADAAQLASLADETPEGRSIVVLAKEKYGLRARDVERRSARRSSPSPRRRA